MVPTEEGKDFKIQTALYTRRNRTKNPCERRGGVFPDLELFPFYFSFCASLSALICKQEAGFKALAAQWNPHLLGVIVPKCHRQGPNRTMNGR